MTLQEFYSAIESGGEGLECPFTKYEHLELENSSDFFENNGALKNDTKSLIKKETVVFFNEIEDGIDLDKCIESVKEWQNSLN